jgi:D-sedoheptulose 7-phosphate isomerase
MDITEKIFEEAMSHHFELLNQFRRLGFSMIQEIINRISNCFDDGGKVLLVGNGGSAADCQHIAGELVGRFKADREGVPAICLACDSSVLTCIGNDFDYETIFSRQVQALGDSHDLLWAISTSGTSANVLKAAKVAKQKGISVLSFTGKTNSPLEKISDTCLCVATNDTAQAQQIHQVAYHIICGYLDQIYDDSPTD